MDNPEQNSIKEKGAALRLRLSDKWQDFRERMHHKHRFVVMGPNSLVSISSPMPESSSLSC